MESTNPGNSAPDTALPTSRRSRIARLWPRMRRRPGVLVCALVLTVLLAAPRAATPCSIFNPICWLEEVLDQIKDIMDGIGSLMVDIITLDPEEFFEDFIDVANDVLACDFGPVTVLSLAVSNGLEEAFDDCSGPSGPIEDDVLAKLGLYFRSSFDSTRIHQDCGDLGTRGAITFGEQVYFTTVPATPRSSSAASALATLHGRTTASSTTTARTRTTRARRTATATGVATRATTIAPAIPIRCPSRTSTGTACSIPSTTVPAPTRSWRS